MEVVRGRFPLGGGNDEEMGAGMTEVGGAGVTGWRRLRGRRRWR